ncbi:MAG: preprotein translocase subunit SecA [Candidatus Brocadiae bacterium]|nr:preprotein translocase subunit SecA [Candidatus Brocadiia bacterium]
MNEWISKFLLKVFGSRNERLLKEIWPVVHKIAALEESCQKLQDQDFKAKTQSLRVRYQQGETLDRLLPEAFALVREASKRTIGLRHFDVQMLGGIVLHQGKISEMITGEGKTLVATCPAYLNALSSRHVHIVTVNDYLAKRDRNWMGPVFEFLGLTVGCIQSEMDSYARIKEYGCDITYGTNNEFGFDYLRDNMKMNPDEQCQKDLYYAIVDEVDSVLIDEARTPLIISGPSEESTEKYYQANQIAKKMRQGTHYELKEKEQMALLTEEGIEFAEKLAGVDSFYKGKNMDWPHHINQALRAHNFFKLDREYVIHENEIIIVDEFTGRLQPGRRWSDGLHQAIEAKEGLRIREENQTLATITFQNYFRLYKKLAGMTGTALTEAMEFDKIYKLDVVVIPPNRPLIRKAHNDVIYGTHIEKFQAIVNEVILYHRTGRPILLGTISIEFSEDLSRMLDRREIPHEVLNAKYHEKEAQIISKAGQLGRVTIATNMAGRGTDIVLGKFTKDELLEHWQQHHLAPKKFKASDPDIEEKLTRYWAQLFLEEKDSSTPLETLQDRLNEYWKEQEMTPLRLCESVAELGGLHVLGSERHDSRRIDNQLRGRCGRQGDPGSSRFYLSFEDDLLRKFAPPAMINLMKRFGMKNGQDIRHPMINNGIVRAQQRVEQFNFEIRKNLLEYDEVMNEQRKIVYDQRQRVLEDKDLDQIIWDMIEDRTLDALDRYLPPRTSMSEWDYEGLCEWLEYKFTIKCSPVNLKEKNFKEIQQEVLENIKKQYDKKTHYLGQGPMKALEKYILLEAIDSKWKDHLYAMDELKSGIGLQAFGQKDPKIEYKKSGYDLFDQMIIAVKEQVSDLIFKIVIEQTDIDALAQIWQPSNFSHQKLENYEAVDREGWEQAQKSASAAATQVKTIERTQSKVGRNDACPCGSGKKYKKCCGKG